MTTSGNASERRVDAGSGIDWLKVYEDALVIHSEAPDTVCVNAAHYMRDHRHTEPYRMGYHHGNPDHWHAAYDEYTGCRS
jgi:hypothetical protein